MGWASRHIEVLRAGKAVSFRPHGSSMAGRIGSGDLVEVTPLSRDPVKGEAVLCTVNGKQFLHLVTAVKDGRYQISNNKGHVNGWTGRNQIYGLVTSIRS